MKMVDKKKKNFLLKIASIILFCSFVGGCSAKSQPATKNVEEEKSSKRTDMLKDFGRSYLNYKTIDERNENIKNYFTKEAQNKNGLNIKVNADIESKGKIINVYQDILNEDEYMIQFYQEIQNNKTSAVLKLVLTTDKQPKIKSMNMFYIQSAYGN